MDRTRSTGSELPDDAARPQLAGDETVDNSPEDVAEQDLVKLALGDAQRVSRTLPGRRRPRRGNPAASGPNSRRGGYSGAGPDVERDPQQLGAVLAGYVEQRGWNRPLAEARVFTDWATLVGADVAAHCSPQALRDGQLSIAAESTAWATQLRLLSATVLARLVDELGPQVVTRLLVTGPVAPSWKHGYRSVRGHRGPRDTYG